MLFTQKIRKHVSAQLRHSCQLIQGRSLHHQRTSQPVPKEAPSDLGLSAILSEDGASSLRRRVDGRKPLPLPPHMDPVRRAQRNRWKGAKAPPLRQGDMTDFTKKLEQNVYAHALMTPVRQCNGTNAHLPSFFLLPLSIVQDEKTKSHAILPTDIFNEVYVTNKGFAPVVPSKQRRSYLQLRLPLLQHISQQKRWIRVLGHEERTHIRRTSYASLTWRKDMEDFLLGMLRDLVMRELNPLLYQPDLAGIEVVQSFADVKDPSSTELVLLHGVSCNKSLEEMGASDKGLGHCMSAATNWFGTLAKTTMTAAEASSVHFGAAAPPMAFEISKPPLDFPVMTLAGRAVPVYDLDKLLGRETVLKLIGNKEKERPQCLVVSQGCNASLKLHEQLLRLQCFLASP